MPGPKIITQMPTLLPNVFKKESLKSNSFPTERGNFVFCEEKWDFHHFIVVQLLSRVQLFATPWTATHIFILRTWFISRFKPLSKGRRCLESVINASSFIWQGMLMGPWPWRENVMVRVPNWCPAASAKIRLYLGCKDLPLSGKAILGDKGI